MHYRDTNIIEIWGSGLLYCRCWGVGYWAELIRAFYAFDTERRGILLCAGNKTGNEKRFYEVMIPIADRKFTAHLGTNAISLIASIKKSPPQTPHS
ncbi:MAG: type II toxin-antitoxin system RelE/ParE family toxin [Desulfatiglandaceae bacterium]